MVALMCFACWWACSQVAFNSTVPTVPFFRLASCIYQALYTHCLIRFLGRCCEVRQDIRVIIENELNLELRLGFQGCFRRVSAVWLGTGHFSSQSQFPNLCNSYLPPRVIVRKVFPVLRYKCELLLIVASLYPGKQRLWEPLWCALSHPARMTAESVLFTLHHSGGHSGSSSDLDLPASLGIVQSLDWRRPRRSRALAWKMWKGLTSSTHCLAPPSETKRCAVSLFSTSQPFRYLKIAVIILLHLFFSRLKCLRFLNLIHEWQEIEMLNYAGHLPLNSLLICVFPKIWLPELNTVCCVWLQQRTAWFLPSYSWTLWLSQGFIRSRF